MADRKDNASERHIYYILIVLGAVLVVLFVFFVGQYRALRREQVLNARELRISQMLTRHAPLPASDAGNIRSWMTFDYINKLFALPPQYLQTQLQITDTHYPRLTIASYATAAHLVQATLLVSVENAVRNYPAPGSATSTPPQNATSAVGASAGLNI